MKRINYFLLLVAFVFKTMPANAQSSFDHAEDEAKRTFVKWERLAMKGDPVACTAVADCYRDGTGVEKDLYSAVSWYKKSIEGGFDVARVLLGTLYESLDNADKAYTNFLSCAELDESQMRNNIPILAMARCKVGEYLLYGYGVAKDENMAIKWYKSASTLNTPYNLAHSCLGYCYLRGQGVERDSLKAFNYFKESVDLTGVEYAKCGLATCYLEGIGCKQNIQMVYQLLNDKNIELNNSKLILGIANYRDSSKEGHYEIATDYLSQLSDCEDKEIKGSALYWLSRCYRFGRGVNKNVVTADSLLVESGKLGYEPSMSLLDIVEQKRHHIKK